MIGRLRRLLDWMLFHGLGATVRGGVEPGEQAASLSLYPTRGRDVLGTPNNAPATLDTSGRSIHEEQSHGRSK